MELYHVLNRGVEKRTIFLDTSDHARFVHNLYEFNDSAPANNDRRLAQMIEIRSQSFGGRKKIVDLHGWCLMGNHYHLLLSERVENGISDFMRKINVGYAMYFNEKYQREGTLFQGKTKKIHIANDAHFLHILHYIHLNPLDFLTETKEWRTLKIADAQQALTHLENYRWSSFLDYMGKKNFPSILTTNLFAGVFGNYRKTIVSYLKDIELAPLKSLTLE
jgi:putative transposase